MYVYLETSLKNFTVKQNRQLSDRFAVLLQEYIAAITYSHVVAPPRQSTGTITKLLE